MQGSLRLFGGFASFQRELAAGLSELGYRFSLASADTARAALWLSRGEGEAFEALPVGVTRFDGEFFKSIGIRTVGELLRLAVGEVTIRSDGLSEPVAHARAMRARSSGSSSSIVPISEAKTPPRSMSPTTTVGMSPCLASPMLT